MPEFMQAAKAGTKAGRTLREEAIAPEKLAFGGAAINEAEGAKVQALREMEEGKLSGLVPTERVPLTRTSREERGAKWHGKPMP